MKIVTVLRSGGEYTSDHVARLRSQVAKFNPDVPFVCLTDVVVPGLSEPLSRDWPGWWSKMCMFENVRRPFLYMDLDTTVVGPLDAMLARQDLTVLSDFYWPEKVQSSLMLVTPEAAAKAWPAFLVAPERNMRECTTRERWGDQGFLEGVWGRDIDRWQSVMPGQAVSYKVHVRRAQDRQREVGNGTVPPEARVVVFHGKPRPWKVGM